MHTGLWACTSPRSVPHRGPVLPQSVPQEGQFFPEVYPTESQFLRRLPSAFLQTLPSTDYQVWDGLVMDWCLVMDWFHPGGEVTSASTSSMLKMTPLLDSVVCRRKSEWKLDACQEGWVCSSHRALLSWWPPKALSINKFLQKSTSPLSHSPCAYSSSTKSPTLIKKKKICLNGDWIDGSGLRALIALTEDQVQFLASTWWYTAKCTSNSKGPGALFWPPHGTVH